jgi:thiamine biosynthesis lipoprotein
MVVTDGTVLVAAAEILRDELERIDRVASRFRPDSELSRLNAVAGRCATVSPDLLEAIDVALRMAEATDGLVDPTVGIAMVHLGYDCDFDDVRGGRDGDLPAAGPVPGWRSVVLDAANSRVRLPPRTALDLGATAKALAADRAAADVARQLGCGVLVSLGGDAAVAGPAPDGGFAIAIADTCTSTSPDEAVAVTSGGLASSGIGVRHWRLGASQVHHIVDPATGLPADTCWRTVSATAATCVEANAATTAAMVMGAPAVDWLARAGIPARLVAHDGEVVRTPGWPEAPRRPDLSLPPHDRRDTRDDNDTDNDNDIDNDTDMDSKGARP